ncbi:MAG: UDP-glucose 4-epimerase GalE [Rhodocyclaceae bacterium]
MRILVTGGAGYIGSHTCVELLRAGHHVTVVDNLANGHRAALLRAQEIAARSLEAFHAVDIRDEAGLSAVFASDRFDVVVHFAALKAVGESVAAPLTYYGNNIEGTLSLCRCMQQHGVTKLVFSSSATVYGAPQRVPIDESFPTSATNPYGWTKWMTEQILRDQCLAESSWRVVSLRYFNPVGAHPSGLIGEDPLGVPNNLMPFVAQVAGGRRSRLAVFGGDYPTRDGTGVRDYIHVVDLALGHVRALERIESLPGFRSVNLGTGCGHTVLEVVAAFERASGRAVPYEIVARRPGDVAACWADSSLAGEMLGWRAERDLLTMCEDAWRWQRAHPEGYGGVEG